MAKWFVIMIFLTLAITQTITLARNVPEDKVNNGLNDEKTFGSFAGDSGGGMLGGFPGSSSLPGFGGSGTFPGISGSSDNGGFGSFPHNP